MQQHECSHVFCDPSNQYGYNLPLYTLDARSEEDVVIAMKFARENGIRVSVKSTGNSMQGTSTSRGSLMIWMRNFPKDDQIQVDYQGKCRPS